MILVVVPCGAQKTWDARPNVGAVHAKDTYTSTFFKLNRAYAERFGHAGVILSAKYGLVRPEFLISGPYNMSFKRKSSNPISICDLREQVQGLGLGRFQRVIGLGGREYRSLVERTFEDTPSDVVFPHDGPVVRP